MGQIRAIREQEGQSQEHAEKIADIVLSNAVHDPYTVMIMLGDAHIAYTTVLASRRLEKLAGTAYLARLIQDVIIWIGA